VLVTRPGAARRIGATGSTSWLVAETVTAAVKPLVGRRRPALVGTGPTVSSSSMPSTHTASAVAYATAAMIQHRAGTALFVPAAGVAWSRVRTRRHFVTDVAVGLLAGGAIGVAVGAASRRVGARRDPARGWDPGVRPSLFADVRAGVPDRRLP
jgi:undecaprenyl-diphosphatase